VSRHVYLYRGTTSRALTPAAQPAGIRRHDAHDQDALFVTKSGCRPEYLKLNPRGLVPTLIHDSRVLQESQVIIEYLEDVFPPPPPLLPADPYDRAQMRLWTKLVDEGLHVDSRTIGQCIAMRFVMQDVDLLAVADFDPEEDKIKAAFALAQATRRFNVARSCQMLLQCKMHERRLLIYKGFLNKRSSFLSASEGNALSS